MIGGDLASVDGQPERSRAPAQQMFVQQPGQ
jgi:hypothetical protein